MIVPYLVERAKQLAGSLGFTSSCLDEVGMLLQVLAGSMTSGRIADIGTGCGVSAAWLSSATHLDVYTVDENLAPEVGELFRGCGQVHPLQGDWRDVLSYGPFRFMFVDAKPAKVAGVDALVQSTEVGGLLVLDDLTPVEFWPDQYKQKPDPVREAWLNHPQLASIEIRTSLKASAIIARRLA